MIVAEKFMINHNEKHTVAIIQEVLNKVSESEWRRSYMFDFNKEKLMQLVKSSNFDC